MLGGGGGRAGHESKVSVVKVFHQQQIRLGATAHAVQSGLTCRPMREEKGWRAQFVQIRKMHGGFSTSKSFSLFQYHWSNEVQPNLIRHQFKRLEKEPLER
jgi:hypothetical protein